MSLYAHKKRTTTSAHKRGRRTTWPPERSRGMLCGLSLGERLKIIQLKEKIEKEKVAFRRRASVDNIKRQVGQLHHDYRHLYDPNSLHVTWFFGSIGMMLGVLLLHIKGGIAWGVALVFEILLTLMHFQPPNEWHTYKKIRRNILQQYRQTLSAIGDTLSRSSWVYFFAYTIPFSIVVGFYLGNNWISFIWAFVAMPVLDAVFGHDSFNPNAEESIELARDQKYKVSVYLWLPTEVALLLWACYIVSTQELSVLQFLGIIVGLGINNAEGMVVSHEMFHKHNVMEQTMGKILLVIVCYAHFFIEHLQGHHKNVATPLDPAQAKLGANFYTYFPKTVIGGYKSAWNIEKSRLMKQNRTMFDLHNQMIWFAVIPVCLASALFYAFGGAALCLFVGSAAVSIVIVEITNYVEHYGLERQELKEGSGIYERVTSLHSWDASHRLSNYFLFKLERHADHHAHASRTYQTLRNFDCSPKLPAGYLTMTIVALIPPLWWAIMDPRVEAVHAEMENNRAWLRSEKQRLSALVDID